MKVDRIEVLTSYGEKLVDLSSKTASAMAALDQSGRLVLTFHGPVQLVITPKPKKPKK